MKTEVQTRSETNGIRNFPSVKEALKHTTEDDTVWKVSFALASGERVRLVRTTADEWMYESIE